MTPKRRRWFIGGAIAAPLAIVVITAAARIPFSSDILRERVVEWLADRLDSEVELGDLTMRLAPRLHAEGTTLTVRHKGRTDVPPLISVKSFTVDTSLRDVWRRRVGRVTLDGLEIQIPPRNRTDDRDGVAIAGHHVIEGRQIVIEEVIADAATLVIIRAIARSCTARG